LKRNNNINSTSVDLSSSQNDPELIKNVREKIASKNKRLGTDLFTFDPNLRHSWLNSFTPQSTRDDRDEKRPAKTVIAKENLSPHSSSFEIVSSKPSYSSSTSTVNENNYLVPVVRKPQLPVKTPSENVNKSVTNDDLNLKPKPVTKSILVKPNIPKEETNASSNMPLANENRYVNNPLYQMNNNNNNSNNVTQTRKIHKIINSITERELEKMSNRIEKRNVRVPELLDDMSLAQGNEKTKLEKELNLLMRKYKFDKKKFRELKKPTTATADENHSEVSTSNETLEAMDDPHHFKRNPNRFASKPSKLKEKTRLEKEIKQYMVQNNFSQESSGYSSYEDSTAHSKSQSMESLLFDGSESTKEARAAKMRRSLSLTKSPTLQSEFVRKTLKTIEKNRSKMSTNQNRWEASKVEEISREYLEAVNIV